MTTNSTTARQHQGGHGDLKATPGPWAASVEARPFPARGHWYVVMDDQENGIGEFYGEDHEANVANLRLAATAPELYEALAQMVAEKRDYMLLNNLGNPDEQHTVKWATAALAKARGDQ